MKHKKTTRSSPISDVMIGLGATMWLLGNLIDDMKRGASDWLIWVDAVVVIALIPWTWNALMYQLNGAHNEPPGGHPEMETWKALALLRRPEHSGARLTDEEVAEFAALLTHEKPVERPPDAVLSTVSAETLEQIKKVLPLETWMLREGESEEDYWTRLCGCLGHEPGGPHHILMCQYSVIRDA